MLGLMMPDGFKEYDDYGLCVETAEAVDLFVSIDINNKENVFDKKNLFTTINQEENIFDSIMMQCRELAAKLDINELVAFMLLEKQNWNIHRLEETWITLRSTMLSSIGMSLSQAKLDPSLHHPKGNEDELLECVVCCDEFPPSQMWCLSCGHIFCDNCWKEEVKSKINQGMSQINCMESGCHCLVPPTSVRQLCEKEEIYNNLLHFIIDQQVNLADTLTHCPNPKCSKPINKLSAHLCNVLKCSCRHEFCSECHNPSHAPATCGEKERWDILTNEDVMQQRLYGDNFKKCPNCQSGIEKNGGCNHMTCTKCRHEFCWLCLKPWKSHPQTFYNCDAYREEEDPYKKRPDNLNPVLLAQYHEKFMKLKLINQQSKDKEEQKIQLMMKKTQCEQGLTDSEVEESIRSLLDELYWATENLKFSEVHKFNVVFDLVKDMRIEDQIKQKSPQQLNCFSVTITLLNEAIDEVNRRIDDLKRENSQRLTIQEIAKMTQKLQLYRKPLLKQCDPHYSDK